MSVSAEADSHRMGILLGKVTYVRHMVVGFSHLTIDDDGTPYYENPSNGVVVRVPTRFADGEVVFDAVDIYGNEVVLSAAETLMEAIYYKPFTGLVLVHLDGNPENCRLDNLRFYIADENGVPQRPVWGTKRNGKIWIDRRIRTPVKVMETGRVYPSANRAAISLHVPRSNICDALAGRRKKVGGFTLVPASPSDVISER